MRQQFQYTGLSLKTGKNWPYLLPWISLPTYREGTPAQSLLDFLSSEYGSELKGDEGSWSFQGQRTGEEWQKEKFQGSAEGPPYRPPPPPHSAMYQSAHAPEDNYPNSGERFTGNSTCSPHKARTEPAPISPDWRASQWGGRGEALDTQRGLTSEPDNN